jgi:hypothetical protein
LASNDAMSEKDLPQRIRTHCPQATTGRTLLDTQPHLSSTRDFVKKGNGDLLANILKGCSRGLPREPDASRRIMRFPSARVIRKGALIIDRLVKRALTTQGFCDTEIVVSDTPLRQ